MRHSTCYLVTLPSDDDGSMSPKLALLEQQKLKKYYPKAQVKILPKVGHFIQREVPELVTGLITDFLDSYR